jgi:hypothetical protein
VRYAVTPSLTCEAAFEATLLRYGDRSYRVGPGHPPLESGSRRFDHRYEGSLGARWTLLPTVALTLDGSYVVRSTNAPDYIPGRYPLSSRRVFGYDIDWDYENALVLLGIEARNAWF